MSIDNPTLAHFRHFSSLLANLPSTFVESPLQIDPFMQNKANLPDDQMNVSSVITREYKNKTNWKLGENKANTKPIKANLLDAQMNVSSILTKDYRKKDDFAVQKNKPNSIPNKANSNPMSKQLVGARPRWAESAKMAQQIDVLKHQNIILEKSNFLHPNSLYSSKQYLPVSGTSFAHLEHMR